MKQVCNRNWIWLSTRQDGSELKGFTLLNVFDACSKICYLTGTGLWLWAKVWLKLKTGSSGLQQSPMRIIVTPGILVEYISGVSWPKTPKEPNHDRVFWNKYNTVYGVKVGWSLLTDRLFNKLFMFHNLPRFFAFNAYSALSWHSLSRYSVSACLSLNASWIGVLQYLFCTDISSRCCWGLR